MKICFKINYTKLYITLHILVYLFITGCIDSPENTSIKIKGTVYDKYGMLHPYSLVSAGDYPIVATDYNGTFLLENENFPYDLTVSDNYRSNSQKFLKLTIPAPNITFLDVYGYASNSNLSVHFPLLGENEFAYIRFISPDLTVQFDNFVNGGDFFNCNVGFLTNKTQITGKLIFLKFINVNGIRSFENFGYKNLVLGSGTQDIYFSSQDISYNPKEIPCQFSVNVQNNYDFWYSIVEMKFKGMHENSNLELYLLDYPFWGYFIVPELPEIEYKIKFILEAGNRTHFGNFSKQWVYKNPGEDTHLDITRTLEIQSPANGEINITNNSSFIFTDPEPRGIYIYQISKERYFGNTANIITTSNNLKLSELSTRLFKFESNKTYYWCVKKYPGYESVDEFASGRLKPDTLFNKIPSSEVYSFTTN